MLGYVKSVARDALRRVGSIFPVTSRDDEITFGIPGRHIFGGYHDMVVHNEKHSALLCQSMDKSFDIDIGLTIDIGFFNTDTNRYKYLLSTDLWSWQQGSRLGWLGPDIWAANCCAEGRRGYQIYDFQSQALLEYFDHGVYDANLTADIITTVDFEHIFNFRKGYGYRPSDHKKVDGQLTGGVDLIRASDKSIIYRYATTDFGKNVQYLNHPKISPMGDYMVLLSCSGHSEGRKRSTELWLCSTTNGDAIKIGTGVSHFCWIGDHNLMITRRRQGYSICYEHIQIIPAGSSSFKVTKTIQDWLPAFDGHPCMITDKLMVTDSYPNRFGLQSVFIGDLSTTDLRSIGKYYSPSEFNGEVRCDLHPRKSSNRGYIDIDTVNRRGERVIKMMVT